MVKIVHHVIIRYQCSFLVDVLLYCAKKSFAKHIGTGARTTVNQYFLSNMTYVTQKSILL